ncbi:hypothetical protein DV517_33840 [Streptomyces sp. S816]|nr:hypothetical protein DV517_33840 [Streptomyces sp. S816]
MRTSWQTRRMRQDPQARKRLAAHLRTLYEQHGATLTELATVAGETRRAARHLLIEAGGTVRTTQQTLRMRTAAQNAKRHKLADSLRRQYEAGATVPELAEECSYSVATVYRLLHQASTCMRPQHNHGPARDMRKRSRAPSASQASPDLPDSRRGRPRATPDAALLHTPLRRRQAATTERRLSRRGAQVNTPFQFQEIKHS